MSGVLVTAHIHSEDLSFFHSNEAVPGEVICVLQIRTAGKPDLHVRKVYLGKPIQVCLILFCLALENSNLYFITTNRSLK